MLHELLTSEVNPIYCRHCFSSQNFSLLFVLIRLFTSAPSSARYLKDHKQNSQGSIQRFIYYFYSISNGFHTSINIGRFLLWDGLFIQEFYWNWYRLISPYFYALRWWGTCIYKNEYVLGCSWINKYITYLCFEIFLNQ